MNQNGFVLCGGTFGSSGMTTSNEKELSYRRLERVFAISTMCFIDSSGLSRRPAVCCSDWLDLMILRHAFASQLARKEQGEEQTHDNAAQSIERGGKSVFMRG